MEPEDPADDPHPEDGADENLPDVPSEEELPEDTDLPPYETMNEIDQFIDDWDDSQHRIFDLVRPDGNGGVQTMRTREWMTAEQHTGWMPDYGDYVINQWRETYPGYDISSAAVDGWTVAAVDGIEVSADAAGYLSGIWLVFAFAVMESASSSSMLQSGTISLIAPVGTASEDNRYPNGYHTGDFVTPSLPVWWNTNLVDYDPELFSQDLIGSISQPVESIWSDAGLSSDEININKLMQESSVFSTYAGIEAGQDLVSYPFRIHAEQASAFDDHTLINIGVDRQILIIKKTSDTTNPFTDWVATDSNPGGLFALSPGVWTTTTEKSSDFFWSWDGDMTTYDDGSTSGGGSMGPIISDSRDAAYINWGGGGALYLEMRFAANPPISYNFETGTKTYVLSRDISIIGTGSGIGVYEPPIGGESE